MGKPKAYWWTGSPNFGDLLTPLLLDWFSNLQVEWAPEEDADLVCAGSILHHLPVGWEGVIAGSGWIGPGNVKSKNDLDFSKAVVLGLRGPLTVRAVTGVRGKKFVLGDPGLLVNELVSVDKEYQLGLVPHWSDKDLEKRKDFLKYDPIIIRPTDPPLEVIRNIGRCHKIVSSSLHGIIVADAFNIPRRTEMCPRVLWEGGDFKFRDHNAAVGVDFVTGVTQFAPRWIVETRQHELYDMFTKLEDIFKA